MYGMPLPLTLLHLKANFLFLDEILVGSQASYAHHVLNANLNVFYPPKLLCMKSKGVNSDQL
jgi:hypothetical protein